MAKRSGQERKSRRRSRRQVHGTYDLERAGIPPEEAKKLAAERRAAPHPRDGILFTGPLNYVLQDISRIQKMMDLEQFDEGQRQAIEKKMGLLIMQGGPAGVAAYKAVYGRRQKDQQLNIKMLEVQLKAYELELKRQAEEESKADDAPPELQQHFHFHGADPMREFIAEMKALHAVGDAYLEDDPEFVDGQAAEVGEGQSGAGSDGRSEDV